MAQARRSRARRTPVTAGGVAGRRLRGGVVVRQRPRDERPCRDGGTTGGLPGASTAAVGVLRILKVLEKHAVKASFYVPAVTALLHPDEQRQVVAEGP